MSAFRRPRPAAVGSALPLLALLALAVAAFLPFTWTGFAGTDSLTLVETSRVRSWADLRALAASPVMDQTTFAEGELVYRPLVSLSFAADFAIWGFNPVGYHLTNLVLHVGTTLAVWALLRGLGLGPAASLVGSALFALHPAAVASVPVIARRDSLVPVAAFTASMALLVRRVRAPDRHGRPWAVAALALFAVALFSKESAYAAFLLVPLLVFGARATPGPAAAGGGRLGPARPVPPPVDTHGGTRSLAVDTHGEARPLAMGTCDGAGPLPAGACMRLLAAYGVLVVVAFGLRLAVLGTLGGYQGVPIARLDASAYRGVLAGYARFLLWPLGELFPTGNTGWLILLVAVLAALLLLARLVPRRIGVVLALGCLWVGTFALFHALVKTFSGAWLVYYPLVGVSLIAGASVDALLDALAAVRARAAAARPASTTLRDAVRLGAAATLGVALAVWSIAVLRTSPLLVRYDDWDVAGAITSQYLAAARDCMREAPDGAALVLVNLPEALDEPGGNADLLAPTLLADHTVEAALRVAYPERRFTIAAASYMAVPEPSGGSLTLTCTGPPPARQLVASAQADAR
jgi:hypothetical protein